MPGYQNKRLTYSSWKILVWQHFRIINKKSSDGFSPWFLLLGCLSTSWSFFNILILQWRSVRCCAITVSMRGISSVPTG
jgi:hypothetical protein